MTVHTIIKECKKRIELLEKKRDLAEMEYSSIIFDGRSKKTDEELYMDKAFNKRLNDSLAKFHAIKKEIGVLRNLIYEYEKEY